MNPHFVSRDRCPACGGTNVRPVFSRSYDEPRLREALERFYAEVGRLEYEWLAGAEFVVDACHDCGLHYQRHVPDDFLLEKLYEQWISPARAFEKFHAHASVGRRLEIARDVAISLALANRSSGGPRALDYGCGWGEWARMTAAFGAESWGTELSESRRAACRRLGVHIAADTELPNAAFDLINADQVFEHLPAPARTLAFLRPKLRPGGVIRVAVPNGWRIQRSLARFDRELGKARLGGLNAIAPLEHLNGFTGRSLIRMAEKVGLARVTPGWPILRQAWVIHGWRAMVKQVIRPWYLRSGWSTQLWFRDAATGPPS